MRGIACNFPPTRRAAYAISMSHDQRPLVSGAEYHQQNDRDQDQARGPDRRAQTRGPVAGARGRVIGAGGPCLVPVCREFVGHGWRRTAPRETEARTPTIASRTAGPVC